VSTSVVEPGLEDGAIGNLEAVEILERYLAFKLSIVRVGGGGPQKLLFRFLV
jgi:hypothetical protein